ncbi:hypothetical protein ACQ4PT_022272 [Festuca glaucescens]
MDLFHEGHHVWLRSRVRGTYLHADDDGVGVSLRRRRASLNAAWVVHLYRGDEGSQFVLLHSAAYGRYLGATDASAPLGHRGFRVAQRNYDQPELTAIMWQAVKPQGARSVSGGGILLRHADSRLRYLRANGRYLRWSNGVSIDEPTNISTMMLWLVEPIPARQGMPGLPVEILGPNVVRLPGDLSVVILRREVTELQVIRYIQFDGYYAEGTWDEVQFRGRSVNHLKRELANRVGLSLSDFVMCIRAGRYGRLTPLVVNLPRDGNDNIIEIVVIMDGTPGESLSLCPQLST